MKLLVAAETDVVVGCHMVSHVVCSMGCTLSQCSAAGVLRGSLLALRHAGLLQMKGPCAAQSIHLLLALFCCAGGPRRGGDHAGHGRGGEDGRDQGAARLHRGHPPLGCGVWRAVLGCLASSRW